MKTIGKFAFAIAVIVLAWGYCELSTAMISRAATLSFISWLYGPQGFTVNCVFLGACTFIFVLIKPRLLPNTYFVSKAFERDGRIYRRFGIEVFQAILRRIGWDQLLRKAAPLRCDISALARYRDTTRGAEAIHMIAAILTAIFTLSVTFRYSFVQAMWCWFFNVLMNAYPIMLQRYNRPRLDRLIQRLEHRATSAAASGIPFTPADAP